MNRRRRTGNKSNENSRQKANKVEKAPVDPARRQDPPKNRRRRGKSEPAASNDRTSRGRGGNRDENRWQHSKVAAYWTKLVLSILFLAAVVTGIVYALSAKSRHTTQIQVLTFSEQNEREHWYSTPPLIDDKGLSDSAISNRLAEYQSETRSLTELLNKEKLIHAENPGTVAGPNQNVVPIWLKSRAMVDEFSMVWISSDERPLYRSGDEKIEGWTSIENVLKALSNQITQTNLGSDARGFVFLDLHPVQLVLFEKKKSDLIAAIQSHWNAYARNYPNLVLVLPHESGQRNWLIPGTSKSVFQYAVERALDGNADVSQDMIITYKEFKDYVENASSKLSMYLSSSTNTSTPQFLEPESTTAADLEFCHVWKNDEPFMPRFEKHGMNGNDLDALWARLDPVLDNWLQNDPLAAVEVVLSLCRLERLWLEGNATKREWREIVSKCTRILDRKPPTKPMSVCLYEKFGEKLPTNLTDEWSTLMSALKQRANPPSANPDEDTKTAQDREVENRRTIEALSNRFRSISETPLLLWQYFADDSYNGMLKEDLTIALTWYEKHVLGTDWNVFFDDGSIPTTQIRYLQQLLQFGALDSDPNLLAAKQLIRCRDQSDRAHNLLQWQHSVLDTRHPFLNSLAELESRRRSLEDRLVSNLQTSTLEQEVTELSKSGTQTSYQSLIDEIRLRVSQMQARNRKLFAMPFLYQFWFANRETISSESFNGFTIPNLQDADSLVNLAGFQKTIQPLIQNDSPISDLRVKCAMLLTTPFLSANERVKVRAYYANASLAICKNEVARLDDKDASDFQTTDQSAQQWDEARFVRNMKGLLTTALDEMELSTDVDFDSTASTLGPYLRSVGDGSDWADPSNLVVAPHLFADHDKHQAAWHQLLITQTSKIQNVRITRLLDDFWGAGERFVAANSTLEWKQLPKPYFDLAATIHNTELRTNQFPIEKLEALRQSSQSFLTSTVLNGTMAHADYETPDILENLRIENPNVSKDGYLTYLFQGRRDGFDATTGKSAQDRTSVEISMETKSLERQVWFRGHVVKGKLNFETVVAPTIREPLRLESNHNKPEMDSSIRIARKNPIPQKAALLIDCSNSMNPVEGQNFSKIKTVRNGLTEFLEKMANENSLDLSIYLFGRTVTFDGNNRELVADDVSLERLRGTKETNTEDTVIALEQTRLTPATLDRFLDSLENVKGYGRTPLYASMGAVARERPQMKRLIVISDGRDDTYQVDENRFALQKNDDWVQGDSDQLFLDYKQDSQNRPLDTNLFYVGNSRDDDFLSLKEKSLDEINRSEAASVQIFTSQNLINLFKFPLIRLRSSDRVVDQSVNAKQLPYQNAERLTSEKFSKSSFANEWFEKDINIDEANIGAKNSLVMEYRRGDSADIIFDETDKRLFFMGPSSNTRNAEMVWQIDSDTTYRIVKKNSSDANDGLTFGFWHETADDSRYTRRPARVVLFAKPKKLKDSHSEDSPGVFLIQDTAMHNAMNVVWCEFPSFDDVRNDKGIRSVARGQWDLTLVAWAPGNQPKGELVPLHNENTFGEKNQKAFPGVCVESKIVNTGSDYQVTIRLTADPDVQPKTRLDFVLVDLIGDRKGVKQQLPVNHADRDYAFLDKECQEVVHQIHLSTQEYNKLKQSNGTIQIRLVGIDEKQAGEGIKTFDFTLK